MRAPAEQRNARGALALSALAIAAFGLGRPAVLVLSLLLAMALSGEQLRISRAAGVKPVAGAALLVVVAMILAGYLRGARAPAVLPALASAGLGLAYVAMLRRSVRTKVTKALIATVIPILTAGVLGAFVPAMFGLTDGARAASGYLALVLGAGAGTAVARKAGASLVVSFAGSALGALVVAAGLAITWPDQYEAGRALVLGALVAGCVPLGAVLAARLAGDLSGDGPPRRAAATERLVGPLLAAPVFFFVYRALTS